MTTTTWMTFPPFLIIMLAKDTLESVLLLWSLGGRYSYRASLPRHTLFPLSPALRFLPSGSSRPRADPSATASSTRLRAESHSFAPRTRSSCASRSLDPAIASELAPPPPRPHFQLLDSLQRLMMLLFCPHGRRCFKNRPHGAMAHLNSLYLHILRSCNASVASILHKDPLDGRCSCAAAPLPGSRRQFEQTGIQVAYFAKCLACEDYGIACPPRPGGDAVSTSCSSLTCSPRSD